MLAARVAGGRLAALVADREPVLALGRRAVRPRLRVDLALRLLLDPVVADRRGGIEPVRDVGLGQSIDVAGLRGVVRPDAGEAVGLQLGAHRAAGRARSARAAAESAEQVLDVVAVLVGEHVRLRERAARRAEAVAQLVEEAEVDVDVLVDRAVERADVGGRGAAAGRRRAVKKTVFATRRCGRSRGTRSSSTPGCCSRSRRSGSPRACSRRGAFVQPAAGWRRPSGRRGFAAARRARRCRSRAP